MQPATNEFEYTRKRYGKGFQYFDAISLQKIACKKKLKSIKGIVIPPMWEEVFITLHVKAKIVAVGRDAKGRKQYIYSEVWTAQQQAQKFSKLVAFASELPDMRKTCRAALKEPVWSRQKVVALMVLILDETGIRIGNKRYSQENDSYGLSTLRRRHFIDMNSEDHAENHHVATFDFTGKSGKHRTVSIDDSVLAQHIKESSQLPGYNLFRYQKSSNKHSFSDVCSDDVNEFIKTQMGDSFSCKDFRTWTGTCLAAEYYWETLSNNTANKRKKLENIVIEKVAKTLGNTPAICREYYIHPTLLAKIEKRKLGDEPVGNASTEDVCKLSSLEKFVLDNIE